MRTPQSRDGSNPEPHGQPVSPWSCFACRRRKIRCDRRKPCSYCIRQSLDCAFPVAGRMPTRQHDLKSFAASSSTPSSTLLGRLRRLEGLVEKLGEGTPSEAFSPDDISPKAGGGDGVEWGRLVVHSNESIYIGRPLYDMLLGEVQHLRQSIQCDPDKLFEEQLLLGSPVNVSSPFFWGDARALEGEIGQPLPSQIPFIWEVFVEKVDPFIKVLHVPTVSKAIRDAKGHFKAMEAGMEALMFAVSLVAVSSLSDDEVSASFHEDKPTFVSRLFLGTEQALSRAGVLTTTNLRVVQALVIYLELLRRRDGFKAVWTLVGLLIRTAMRMGLHRDTSQFEPTSINVLDAEIRRRVWWHICILDTTVSGCHVFDVGISEESFDTRTPAHIADELLTQQSQSLPSIDAEDTCSSMTLYTVRCELWRLERRFRSTMGHNANAEAASAARKRLSIESKRTAFEHLIKYLRPRDDAFHLVLHTVICMQITTLDLVSMTLPAPEGADSSDDESAKKAFLLALASLHHVFSIIDSQSGQRWSWALHGCLNWQMISAILSYLVSASAKANSWGPVSEVAWILSSRAFEHLSSSMAHDPMRTTLFGLMRSAERRREILLLDADLWWRTGSSQGLDLQGSMPDIGDFRDSNSLAFDTSALQDQLALETCHWGGPSGGDIAEQASSNYSRRATALQAASNAELGSGEDAWISQLCDMAFVEHARE
jgi:hypothetical protein